MSGNHPNRTLSPERVEEALRECVGRKNYPCIAAIAAVQQGDYRIGAYGEIASEKSTSALGQDLYRFIAEYQASQKSYLSFVAGFYSDRNLSEVEFENLLWRQLQMLHDREKNDAQWDPRVCSDPSHKSFCFSFGGAGCFVVGMHPSASRLSRQFPFPTLIFNLSAQFEVLIQKGIFYSMKQTIREREILFQGSVNPMVTGVWEDAEAAQYSGRRVDTDWKCPFTL